MKERLPALASIGAVLGLCASISGAFAQATDPFLAQIMIFPGNFCPKGWAPTNGQLLPINQNQALFSLLGTMYGGDGRVTFALPIVKPIISVSGQVFTTCIAVQGVFPSRS